MAVGQIDPRRIRIFLQVGQPIRAADGAMQELVGGKTISSKAQGTRHDLAETHGAIVRQHGQQSRDHAGNRGAEDPRRDFSPRRQIVLGGRSLGRPTPGPPPTAPVLALGRRRETPPHRPENSARSAPSRRQPMLRRPPHQRHCPPARGCACRTGPSTGCHRPPCHACPRPWAGARRCPVDLGDKLVLMWSWADSSCQSAFNSQDPKVSPSSLACHLQLSVCSERRCSQYDSVHCNRMSVSSKIPSRARSPQ